MQLALRRGPGAGLSRRQSRRPALAVRYRPEPGARAPAGKEGEDGDDRAQASPSAIGLALLRETVPLVTLDHADQALQEYCSSKPSDDAREQCLEVR
jgi:hypothetical protein